MMIKLNLLEEVVHTKQIIFNKDKDLHSIEQKELEKEV